MAKRSQEARSYPVNINYFADKCRNINSAGLNLEFKSENPSGNGVWFRIHHGMSMTSYGEKITITLTPAGANTEVNILSECGMPTQLVDYGRNAKNVKAIFDYLENGMPQGQQTAPVNTAPAAQAPQDAGFVFCPACGKRNSADANFCGGCGNKLK